MGIPRGGGAQGGRAHGTPPEDPGRALGDPWDPPGGPGRALGAHGTPPEALGGPLGTHAWAPPGGPRSPRLVGTSYSPGLPQAPARKQLRSIIISVTLLLSLFRSPKLIVVLLQIQIICKIGILKPHSIFVTNANYL